MRMLSVKYAGSLIAENKVEEFADVLAWLCTLANINDIDLEKACEKYSKNNVTGFK